MSAPGGIVLTGGGSGGHVYPALPVAAALRARGDTVCWIGSHTGIERDLVGAAGIPYHAIATGKLRRYLSRENVVDAFRVVAGIVQAFVLLGRLRPRAVFSKGGYVALPVVVAAALRGIPVVAHESDLYPGLANRLSLPFVRRLCVTFAGTRQRVGGDRTVLTGLPVRPELLAGVAARGAARVPDRSARPLVLVMGGSLGSVVLNAAVDAARGELLACCDLVHLCGRGRLDGRAAGPGYLPLEYASDDLPDLLAAADLVVSRAGATTLYELLVLRRPSLLVPLTRRASRGDQIDNAAMAADQGWAHVADEDRVTAGGLPAALAAALDGRAAMQAALARFVPGDPVAAIVAEIDAAAAPRG